jgi:hypothetical protein
VILSKPFWKPKTRVYLCLQDIQEKKYFIVFSTSFLVSWAIRSVQFDHKHRLDMLYAFQYVLNNDNDAYKKIKSPLRLEGVYNLFHHNQKNNNSIVRSVKWQGVRRLHGSENYQSIQVSLVKVGESRNIKISVLGGLKVTPLGGMSIKMTIQEARQLMYSLASFA